MCKVLMIPGIKKQHQEKVQALATEVGKNISRTDDDGIGYAAITSKGKIYGEKWLRPTDAFVLHGQPTAHPAFAQINTLLGEAAGKQEGAPMMEKLYDSFGMRTAEAIEDTVALVVHARKKTFGEKSIVNTHPFVVVGDNHVPDTALIHNGSIQNHLSLTKKTSTCDSETILHEYLNECMYYNAYAVDAIAKTLVGEYTVGVLSSMEYEDNTVQPILDIFKSNKDLYCCYVNELETFVFCTIAWPLEQALKTLNMSWVAMTEIKDGYLLRINAITGERMDDVIKFELSPKTVPYSAPYTAPQTYKPKQIPPSNVRPMDQAKRDTVTEIKKKFEMNHGDLFGDNYYDVTDGLSDAERAYYDELDKNPATDLKALKLVKMIMAK